MLQYDILIIGAGASGLAAASAACESDCSSVLVVDSNEYPGGILMQCLHNGFGAGKTGPEFCADLLKQFYSHKARLMLETEVIKVNEDKTALLSTKSGLITVSFKILIMATGCMEIPFGALGISGTRPEGIYSAGYVQRQININKCFPDDNIVVIGCGDLGMIVSGTLAAQGKKVISVVERNSSYSGLARNYRKYIQSNNINVLFNTTVLEVYGDKHIEAVKLNDGSIICCSTLITAAGLSPDRQLTFYIGEKPWIKFCGNCSKVHNIIESAVDESEITAKEAVMEIEDDRYF